MYLFDDQENQKRLKEELEGWVGTPFRHWCGVKGEGCDCIHLVQRVLRQFGKGPLTVQHYTPDWHLHNTMELLFEGIAKTVDIERVSLEDLRTGDIVLFKYGKTMSHCAWFVDGYLYHALYGSRVVKTTWRDKMWNKRARLAMRVKA